MNKMWWITRWGNEVSETFIASDENQIWPKFQVFNVFTTLLLKLDLCLKQSPAYLLIPRSLSYQHLVVLNWSFPSFQLSYQNKKKEEENKY